MELKDVYAGLGSQAFDDLLRRVSMGRLRTYQLFDRLRVRAHLNKLNTEHLRKAAPRLWDRIAAGDGELASDLAQAVLVSQLDMVIAALNLLGIPHQDGFFAKDIDAGTYLTEGWQQRAWDALKEQHPRPALLFYLNHLAVETGKAAAIFAPADAAI